MCRRVTAAISETHACAMRIRLAQVLGRDEAARLACAAQELGADHPLAKDVDYFLRVCHDDTSAVARQADRLRRAVLAHLAPAPPRDFGQIYG